MNPLLSQPRRPSLVVQAVFTGDGSSVSWSEVVRVAKIPVIMVLL